MEQASKQAITAACGAVAMAAGQPGSCCLHRLRNVCACLDGTLGGGGAHAWILVFGGGGHASRTACAFSADAPPRACELGLSAALFGSLCQEGAWTVIRKRPDEPSSLWSENRSTATAAAPPLVEYVETWPAGSPPVLEMGDTLALPLQRQHGQPAGALLLGAACGCFAPIDGTDGGIIRRSGSRLGADMQPARPDGRGKRPPPAGQQQQQQQQEQQVQQPNGSALTREVASEALRLAQFVGLALFGDAAQAAYFEQVSTLLCQLLDPDCPGLHDLVAAVLEALPPLLYSKFALVLQPLLVAVTATTAITFSRRRAIVGAGGMGATAGSQGGQGALQSRRGTPTGMAGLGGAVLLAGPTVRPTIKSVWPLAAVQAAGGRGPKLRMSFEAQELSQRNESSCRDSRYYMIDVAGVESTAPDGGGSTGNNCICGPSRVKAVRTTLAHTLLQRLLRHRPHGMHEDPAATRQSVSHPVACSPGGAAARAAAVSTLMVADASSLATEDVEPTGRDVLLAANLTGAAVASLVLCAEQDPMLGQQEAQGPQQQQPEQPARRLLDYVGGGKAAAPGVESGQDLEFDELCTRTSLATPPGPPPPSRLALYVISAELVPAGVLEVVAAEVAGLMPVVFEALRMALMAHPTLSAEWGHLADPHRHEQPQPHRLRSTSGAGMRHGILGSPVTGGAATPRASFTARELGGATSADAPPFLRSPSGIRLAIASSSALSLAPQQQRRPMSGLRRSSAVSPLPPVEMMPEPEAVAVQYQQQQQRRAPSAGSVTQISIRRAAAASTHLAYLQDSKSGKEAASIACGTEDAGYCGDRQPIFHTTRAALRVTSCPVLEVEEAAGLRPLELLVSSARNHVTALASGSEAAAEARLAASQDLAAVQLHEVIGKGGQGVIFRGALHGLECAIKVLEHGGPDVLAHDGADTAPPAVVASAYGRGARGRLGDGRPDSKREAAAGRDELGTSLLGVEQMRQTKRGALEVAVMATLSHPNIVQVFAQFSEVMVTQRKLAKGGHTLRLCALDDPVAVAHGARNGSAGPRNSVLCLEYCDCGSLADAVRRGDFRLPGSGPEEGAVWPSLVPLYTSLLEVALSLRYLHSRRLVHCDLKPQNVLLKSTARDPRGWSCKLSDFGCVRLMDETGSDGQPGFTATMVCGTVPYMCPELFQKGRLQGPALDTYSFGVLMWELMHGHAPFSGVNWREVPALVVRQGVRPEFHPLAPLEYSALASRCWSPYPEQRPTTGQLVLKLQRLLSAAKANDAATVMQWQQFQPSRAVAQLSAVAPLPLSIATAAGGDLHP